MGLGVRLPRDAGCQCLGGLRLASGCLGRMALLHPHTLESPDCDYVAPLTSSNGIAVAFGRGASASGTVANECTDADDEHAEKPDDNHYFAEEVMPAAKPSDQQHRAPDHEGRGSDGTGEPLEIAAEATSQGLQGGSLHLAQIAFSDTSEDASRVAGRIIYQALQFARKLDCLFLHSRR